MTRATRRTAPAPGRPECEAWLTLVSHVFERGLEEAWARMVGASPPHGSDGDGTPLLAGRTLPVEVDVVRRHVQRLLATAARLRGEPAPTRLADADVVALLEAAIGQAPAAIARVAERARIDPDQLGGLAPLVAMPLAQAYRRVWGHQVSPHWDRPFCPVCGAWPALAEVRGLERARRFRCLRCAADWCAAWLACPYCGNRAHAALGALVPDGAIETRKAETCARCRGYVKSVATLQPSTPPELARLDVETIELDIAAVEHGYHRPETLGRPVRVRLEPERRWRLFGWRP